MMQMGFKDIGIRGRNKVNDKVLSLQKSSGEDVEGKVGGTRGGARRVYLEMSSFLTCSQG